ncbi:MAG: pirin family protein [Acidiferrobacteraceae bacterium]|nr:pirin family protein [Acidiferrobacteraceae bacterium]
MTEQSSDRSTSQLRTVLKIISGVATSDGAGVSLTRYIGSTQLDHLDPFLMLDFFESDNPDDYIAGFPAHPHRGFETVTYLLAGRMRHEDSAGHGGVIEAGGIQWMSAGGGIIHSEMPEQEHGRLAGFQLWVNLPGRLKMSPPDYREFPADDIPEEVRDNGVKIRVITGTTSGGTRGPVANVVTRPLYLDVSMPLGSEFIESLRPDQSAFVFVIDGAITIGGRETQNSHTVSSRQLAVLGPGKQVNVLADDDACRFLLVAGDPIGEPVSRHGPFVMNTHEEIIQAVRDFNAGSF